MSLCLSRRVFMHMPVFPASCVPYISFYTVSPHSLRLSCWADTMYQILFENKCLEVIITLFLFFICEGEFSSRDWRLESCFKDPHQKLSIFKMAVCPVAQNRYCGTGWTKTLFFKMFIAKILMIWKEIMILQIRKHNSETQQTRNRLENFWQPLLAKRGRFSGTEYICRKVVRLNFF